MYGRIETASLSPISKIDNATLRVPGSKSYSLRALLISALCEKEIKIKNLLDSDDTLAMKNCLENLKNKQTDLTAQESGLTARFITVLACVSPGVQTISGTPGLQKRPIKDLVDALRQLSAEIEYTERDGFLPLKVKSSELTGSKVNLKGDVSSQYLSALLLIGPTLENGLVIELRGEQISKPYIDMTIDIMSHFGVVVKNHDYKKYEIKPQKYQAKDYFVEGDFSSSAYFFASAALNGSKIKVENLNPASKQADRKFLDILVDMGSKIENDANSITLNGGGVKPVNVNMQDCPDQAMTMAVLASFASGKTTIDGISSLRVKETERIAALENELAKMGIETSSTKDSLTIYGGKPSGATIDAYGDHRIAMSFAVAGTKIKGMEIFNPDVVDKTFPDFWHELAKITDVQSREKTFSSILLIGMRGSGKTTAGKILAEKLGKKFIDMDEMLEQKQSMRVRDIVLTRGWDYFRKLESDLCKEISRESDYVMSSGGGIVLDRNNMKLFEENTVSVLFKADPAILSDRIKNDKNRPELSTQPTLLGELDDVWKKRKSKYYSTADFIIDTSHISPKQAVDEIMGKLEIQ
jgi:3-phosphoshikimate 1-carboxyvinyltransferase